MLNKFALAATACASECFLNASAVSADANLSPSEGARAPTRGYGGDGARAHLTQTLKKPCQKKHVFTQKTNCLFFKLAQNSEGFIMTKLNDLLAQPSRKITLSDVLDAVRTYCPEYMHGIPKNKYIRCLERTIKEPPEPLETPIVDYFNQSNTRSLG